MNTTKHPSKMKTYLAIIGITVAVMTTTSILGTFISYPTQQHRITAQRLDELNRTMANDPTGNTEAIKLANSSEATYSATASMISSFVQLVIYITLTGLIYNYIRRHNLSRTNRGVGMTTALLTLGAVGSIILTYYPLSLLTGVPLSLDAWLVVGLIGVAIFNIIFTFIIALIFEYSYNKQHSIATTY